MASLSGIVLNFTNRIQEPHFALFGSISFIGISILEHKGKVGRKAMKGQSDLGLAHTSLYRQGQARSCSHGARSSKMWRQTWRQSLQMCASGPDGIGLSAALGLPQKEHFSFVLRPASGGRPHAAGGERVSVPARQAPHRNGR